MTPQETDNWKEKKKKQITMEFFIILKLLIHWYKKFFEMPTLTTIYDIIKF